MKRMLICAIATIICSLAFAQPKGMPQPKSTYELADEVRNKLNLDHSQFEKVYSAYEKYNKAVFGAQSNGMGMHTPPLGSRPGGPGNHPEGGMPGGPGFGGGRPGGHPDFNGPRPKHSGNNGFKGKEPKHEDFQKMEKKRAKQEEKLMKSMHKIFKKDPSAFAKWQTIREEQLKHMLPMPPFPDSKNHD